MIPDDVLVDDPPLDDPPRDGEVGVSSAAAVVKVGDTPADILEGRNAGVWTIGVTASSEVGRTEEEVGSLPASAR